MATQVGGLSNNGAVPRKRTFPGSLSSGQNVPSPQKTTPSGTINLGQGSSVDQSLQLGNTKGLIQPHPQTIPSTPVKKTSTTDTAGNTTTTEYHAPETQSSDSQLSSNTSKNNTSNYGTNTLGQAPNVTRTPTSFAGQIPNVIAAGQTTPDERAFQDQYVKSVQGKQFGQLAPYAESSMYAGKSPEQLQGLITAPDLSGRASADTGLFNQLGNAYGTAALAGLGAAQTSAARNLTAQHGVLNAISPVTQFGQLTSPITGNPITGGDYTGNPQLQSAIQQAVQLVQNGAAPNDPAVQSLISTFGLPGQQAFTNAMQQVNAGTYNPTSANAFAQSNVTQGIDYKQAAVDLDTSLKQLDAASQLADNFLTSNKLLNPTDNPKFNAGINTYIGTFNDPAARLQYNAILGDIKKFTSTILASNNGTIPTDVTNTLSTFDPSTLSAAQLKPYLEALAQLGNNQKSVIQTQISKLTPNQSGYTGSPTSVSTTPVTTPKSSQTVGSKISNPLVQGAIGTIMNIGGAVTGAISGLAKHVLGL